MPKDRIQELIKKYNVCANLYTDTICSLRNDNEDFLASKQEYSEILKYVVEALNSEDNDYNSKILKFITSTLSSFSKTYDVNIILNFDDFKIIYFITLYFVKEDSFTKNRKELNILFFILHKLLCRLLITKKPMVILNKFERFFRLYDYEKIKEEYGDIGYYHVMKSIYLMQKEIYQDLLINEVSELNDEFVKDYFRKIK